MKVALDHLQLSVNGESGIGVEVIQYSSQFLGGHGYEVQLCRSVDALARYLLSQVRYALFFDVRFLVLQLVCDLAELVRFVPFSQEINDVCLDHFPLLFSFHADAVALRRAFLDFLGGLLALLGGPLWVELEVRDDWLGVYLFALVAARFLNLDQLELLA